MDIPTTAREYELDADGVRITMMRGRSALFTNVKEDLPQELKSDLFHTHSGFELFCAAEGPVLLFFEDTLCTLEKGQAAIIPPDTFHHAVFSDPSDKLLALNYMLHYQHDSQTARLLQHLHSEAQPLLRLDEHSAQLAHLLAEALQTDRGSLCCLYMLALLTRFAQRCTPVDRTAAHPSDNTAGRLYRIDQAIFSHHTDKLPLSRLAQEMHLSVRQLSRIISKHYGASYRSKNKQLRMESAARRLQQGEPIALVAAAEGYHSLSAFYAAFRSTFGMTPAAYRRSKRTDTP